MISWQRLIALVCLFVLIFLSSHHHIDAQAVTEGYNADKALERGLIVGLKKNDSTKVESINSDAAEHILGVIVGINDAPVTISADGQRVFVATNGHYDVLVGTQNGAIESGDYIAISAYSGIGMKAGSKEPYVIGRALSGFDGKKDVISNSEVKDTAGATHKVAIGRVSADVGVAKNPLLKATEPDLPSALRKAAQTIAGKPVDAVRVYLGIVVFAITTLAAGSLLYGGVRSALISVGRNPLSRKSIIRGMFQVVITGLIVFITGVFGVYLILRL